MSEPITGSALLAAGFEQADDCFLWHGGGRVRFGLAITLQGDALKKAGISISMGQFFIFARAEVFPVDMEGVLVLKEMLTRHD